MDLSNLWQVLLRIVETIVALLGLIQGYFALQATRLRWNRLRKHQHLEASPASPLTSITHTTPLSQEKEMR